MGGEFDYDEDKDGVHLVAGRCEGADPNADSIMRRACRHFAS
jgi:hypothetical protein